MRTQFASASVRQPLSSVNVNSKSSVTINRQLHRVCLLQSSLVEIAHLLSISVLASCPTRAQLTWQLSVHFCASRHQVSGNHSLTEDVWRQKPIICGPLQNADHASADDRHSVSAWAVLIAGAMVNWASKNCHHYH
jgi:hypothetical protein